MRTSLLLCIALLFGAENAPLPKPLTRAHSHNDYEHPRPLQDALDQGFNSVEADIHLLAGRLLVGHDPRQLRPDRTLQSLYLDPLKTRVAGNAGHVYPDGPDFHLLIDVKSDARLTYAALKDALQPYAPILTHFQKNGPTTPGPITIVISGNRDRATMTAEPDRLAALDGFLSDLTATPPPPPGLVPWVSAPWSKSFKWKGDGPFPPDQAAQLKSLVTQATAQHRLLRFWDAPDAPAAWKVLHDANVPLINTDDLPGLAKFLNNADGR
jgi:hypothetical protein